MKCNIKAQNADMCKIQPYILKRYTLVFFKVRKVELGCSDCHEKSGYASHICVILFTLSMTVDLVQGHVQQQFLFLHVNFGLILHVCCVLQDVTNCRQVYQSFSGIFSFFSLTLLSLTLTLAQLEEHILKQGCGCAIVFPCSDEE